LYWVIKYGSRQGSHGYAEMEWDKEFVINKSKGQLKISPMSKQSFW